MAETQTDRNPGFERVDESGFAAELIAYLDGVARREDVRRVHAAAARLLHLRPGENVLEVGCGLGETARDMARAVSPGGSVIATDVSAAMLTEARRRHDPQLAVAYQHADVTALPYADASFDAVRCERVLQHVHDPDRSLDEMVRVTRPGGRVLVIDTDWAVLAVDIGDTDLADRVVSHGRSRVPHPRIGLEMRRRMVAAGLRDVTADAYVLTLTSHADAAEVLGHFDERVPPEADVIPAADREAWFAAVRAADEQGVLTVSSVGYIVLGHKR